MQPRCDRERLEAPLQSRQDDGRRWARPRQERDDNGLRLAAARMHQAYEDLAAVAKARPVRARNIAGQYGTRAGVSGDGHTGGRLRRPMELQGPARGVQRVPTGRTHDFRSAAMVRARLGVDNDLSEARVLRPDRHAIASIGQSPRLEARRKSRLGRTSELGAQVLADDGLNGNGHGLGDPSLEGRAIGRDGDLRQEQQG
jgi:hypothetical protein